MLRIFLFGPLRLEFRGQPYKLAGLPKISSLLAFLLLHRAHPLEREHVAFTLWADDSETNARANLRRHLHDLKRALPQNIAWIHSDAETVQWNNAAPFWCDVAEFEMATNDERQTTNESSHLSSAVALYRGDFCENLYDDWLVPERERLRAKFISVLQDLIQANTRAENPRAALEYTQQLARIEPTREETYRQWMRLLAANGDRAGVVRVYNLSVNVLERELAVEPAPETQQLYEQLVRQENISASVPPRARNNVPHPLTSLIGRAKEVDEIYARLQTARLVTLTGTGGVGKTRLVLEAAHALTTEFPEKVWFLDLAAVNDPAQMVSYVAETLELVETTNRPLRAVLLETLHAREMLLLFDNCEHVIDAAAKLAHEILSHCPRVKILATSRQALRVPGEQVIAIAPLAIPRETNAPDAPSMQLLIERARAAQPSFALTAENVDALARICRALEGIPLALELAAARLNVLGAKDLAARLESQVGFLGASSSTASTRIVPERHQTLQATFDWSFGALTRAQQILLARLSVFPASFTLTAAEEICSYAPLTREKILPLVSDLIEKTLVLVEADSSTMRYRLLNVTREFALARLGDGIEQARYQLLAYYVERVESQAAFFHEPRQVEAYAWVHDEYGNVRVALETAWTMELSHELARLGAALWKYWWTRGQLTEGRMWLERALNMGEQLAPTLRAELLNGAGRLAVLQEDLARARPLLEEQLVLRREMQDALGIGEALNSLGALYYRSHDVATAYAAYQESLEIFRALQHTGLTARALANLGELDVLQGAFERGLARLEESRALFQSIGALRGESFVLINLGTAALELNDMPRARAALRDSLVIKRALQDQDGIAWTLEGLAVVCAREYDLERALVLFGAAAHQRAHLGTFTPPIFLVHLEKIPQHARAFLAPPQIDALIAHGRALPIEQAISLALGTTNL